MMTVDELLSFVFLVRNKTMQHLFSHIYCSVNLSNKQVVYDDTTMDTIAHA